MTSQNWSPPSGTASGDGGMCQHCGMGHTGACPRVKTIEYHQNGTVKRVEYFEPQPLVVGNTDPIKWTPVISGCGNDLSKPRTSWSTP